MNEQDDLPPAVGQVNGESDMRVERAGVETRDTPRPIPAEPVEPPPDPEAKVAEEQREAEQQADGEEKPPPDTEPTD
ncbi:hypothetical protein [Nonomuraea typhae]|uniref:hypothetical protein n=1 Tax=Nonomuraea typhae TaxID=2603600 RepID=UPI0012F872FF|nr:hypothetical protein [Nonomuraea typhae]